MPPTPPRPTDLLPLKNEVLWLLLALHEGPLHGYGLMQEVEERTGGALRIQTGALYRVLHRMEADGLIAEAEPPAEASDERRRYYALTPFGTEVLAAELERMRRLVQSGARQGLVSPAGGA